MAKPKLVSFQFISDSRFDTGPGFSIKEMDLQLREMVSQNPLEIAQDTGLRILKCKDGSYQLRVGYWIRKTGKITYNEIYRLINSIKPVPYTLCRDWD